MPTYDYECDACGYTFEEFQSITAKPLKECPKCKKKQLRRLIGSGAGVIFKGSGFYETDYKRKNRSSSKDSKSSSSDSGASSSESKSDSSKSENKSSSSKNDSSSKGD